MSLQATDDLNATVTYPAGVLYVSMICMSALANMRVRSGSARPGKLAEARFPSLSQEVVQF